HGIDGRLVSLCLDGRCPATERHQSTIYTMGRPTNVPGFAGQITYSENGLVKQISHSNSVTFTGATFTQLPDASGMARPGSISTNRQWSTENYQYDAAGNIKKIGSKTFSYDLSSRLTSATIPGVTLPYRGYQYDV